MAVASASASASAAPSTGHLSAPPPAEPAPSAKGGRVTKGDETAVLLEPRYTPFQLAECSAFSKSKLSPKHWASLSPVQKAKYQAYTSPSAAILNCVAHSEKRIDGLIKEEKKRVSEDIAGIKARMVRAEDTSLVGPAAARRRMQKRHQEETEAKNMDLQALIEGQRSSFDAIRLKEYLLSKQTQAAGRPLNDKDRRRVEMLLSL
ncbi:hypothetical protein SeMB42_g03391 [Synchytrium endobioticum]|uniref:Uncharacterized protein n=1 Tax=Synchytrium endobioticum TaxID=286115 RepID=A0A507C8D3_9FUNG|nr:hypothetical protein SeLEV6574_g07847 [Synchytrium endobioticum]TPX47300.1 hypothetical protein SeMB42_g03391 [Synchytrium endobioticum]